MASTNTRELGEQKNNVHLPEIMLQCNQHIYHLKELFINNNNDNKGYNKC